MKMEKKIKFSNVILVIVLVLLIMFTIKVLHIVEYTGYEPSTLIASVYGAALGEFGILGWIKNTKTNNSKFTDMTDVGNDDEEEGVG